MRAELHRLKKLLIDVTGIPDEKKKRKKKSDPAGTIYLTYLGEPQNRLRDLLLLAQTFKSLSRSRLAGVITESRRNLRQLEKNLLKIHQEAAVVREQNENENEDGAAAETLEPFLIDTPEKEEHLPVNTWNSEEYKETDFEMGHRFMYSICIPL
jgi:hypothetical protein